MDLGITGKVIVSGSSKGIGRAVAQALAAEGCNVLMTARGEADLAAAADEVRGQARGDVHHVAADMTTQEDVDRWSTSASAVTGAVDIAIRNVAGPKSLGFEGTDDQAYIDAYRSMVLSVVWLARVLPSMRSAGWVGIVNIGSDDVKDVHREVPLLLANITRARVTRSAEDPVRRVAPDGGSAPSTTSGSAVNSVGEFYSVALTNNYQQADTGTKMIHIGKNTAARSFRKAFPPATGRTPIAAG